MYVYVLLLVFPAIMAFAAAMDLLTMRIPNRISIALAVAFFVAAPFAGLSLHDVLSHAAAGAVVLAAAIGLFAFGGFGGGDGKLLAAAALWIGFEGLVMFLAFVAVAGGVLAVAILFYRRVPAIEALPVPEWALKLHERGTGIPYGIAIAAGALLIYPHTAWFAALAS
jgi:prepilin peptidase CpaA